MRKSIPAVLMGLLLLSLLLAGCNGETSARLVTVGLNLGQTSAAGDGEGTKYINPTVPEPTSLASTKSYKITVTDLSDNANRYVDLRINNVTWTETTRTSANDAAGHKATTFTVTTEKFGATDANPQFVLTQGVWKFEVTAYDNTDPAAQGAKQIGYGSIARKTLDNSSVSLTIVVVQDFGNPTATLTVQIGSKDDQDTYTAVTTSASATKANERFAVRVDDEYYAASDDEKGVTVALTTDMAADKATHSVYGTLTYGGLETGWHYVGLVHQQRELDTDDWETMKEYSTWVHVLEDCTVVFEGTLVEGPWSSGNKIAIKVHYITIRNGGISVTSEGVVSLPLGNILLDGAEYNGTVKRTWRIGGADAVVAETISLAGKQPGDYPVTCLVTITADGKEYDKEARMTIAWNGSKVE